MRILLLCHSFNSLTQRLHVELRERGHLVSVEFDINDAVTRDAVALFAPDLVIAGYLKRAIPEDVWRMPDRAPGRSRRPGALGARLGDPRRRYALGRDAHRSDCGNGCRSGLGMAGIPHAGGGQVEPLSP